MGKTLKDGILLIVCHYRAELSDFEFYDNRDEDLANTIMFASQDKELTRLKFKEIIKNEKEKSWLSNYSTYNLPDYITFYEDKDEFYCKNEQTKEFTHIQIVHSILSNE